MIRTLIMDSPVGKLRIQGNEDILKEIRFNPEEALFGEKEQIAKIPELLKETERQLKSYFKGDLKQFDLPFSVSDATPFQRKAYKALLEIPYGWTISYGELAEITGNPNGSRAVGNAMNKNPLPILIPCHRVIGSNRDLTGFAAGIHIKNYLLALENSTLNADFSRKNWLKAPPRQMKLF